MPALSPSDSIAVLLAHTGHIARVRGIRVGHSTDARRPTGCSVVLCPQGAVAAVDVRGAAPGTRETDLLHPTHLVQQVHAVLLTGGSAWGLDAAGGVMHWLEEHGAGLPTGYGLVPLVPAAALFDLGRGNPRLRPDAQSGLAACASAWATLPLDAVSTTLSQPEAAAAIADTSCRPAEGSVGAGAGASVGKLFGLERAMQGGIGTASVTVGEVTVGALIACNAVGDVRHPEDGRPLAGARVRADSLKRLDTSAALLQGIPAQSPLPIAQNTTIGVVATDAALTKAQAQRLAVMAHDGLARTIAPVHTMLDGDTLFALSTGLAQPAHGPGMDLLTLGAMAVQAVSIATARAVLLARPTASHALPCWAEVAAAAA